MFWLICWKLSCLRARNKVKGSCCGEANKSSQKLLKGATRESLISEESKTWPAQPHHPAPVLSLGLKLTNMPRVTHSGLAACTGSGICGTCSKCFRTETACRPNRDSPHMLDPAPTMPALASLGLLHAVPALPGLGHKSHALPIPAGLGQTPSMVLDGYAAGSRVGADSRPGDQSQVTHVVCRAR